MARSKGFRVTVFILKIIGVFVVIAVNGLLFWKMCSMKTPDKVAALMPNDKLVELYKKEGDELELFKQKYDEFTRAERNYAYFAVIDAIFIPSIDQLQLVLRYNDSTVDALVKDYELDERPPTDSVLYDVTVVKVVDITPDNTEDNEKGEGFDKTRISPSDVISEKKGRHNYFRYVFDGVSTEDAAGIFVDIYYVNDVNYDNISYGSVMIYDAQNKKIPVKLDRASKKALGGK